jgi:TatA/E family protein of Tat protein translocase
MFGGIGTGELLVIFFVILLVFGAKKLPELAQGLGKGIREFRRASSEIQQELDVTKPVEAKPKSTVSAEQPAEDKGGKAE